VIEPGEIYIADFARAGPYPVIAVSREELNRGHYTLVVELHHYLNRCKTTGPKLLRHNPEIRDFAGSAT